MPTEKQLAANRANALKSTGPRSAEGKAASSQNALKSGIDAQSQIIRGEDPAELQALTAQYLHDYPPQTAGERAQVDVLINAEWCLRRLRKTEAHLWEEQLAHYQSRRPEDQLLSVVTFIELSLVRLERRRDLLERAHRRALHDLLAIQQSRPQPQDPPAVSVEPPAPSFQTPNPEIGFVPLNHSGGPSRLPVERLVPPPTEPATPQSTPRDPADPGVQ